MGGGWTSRTGLQSPTLFKVHLIHTWSGEIDKALTKSLTSSATKFSKSPSHPVLLFGFESKGGFWIALHFLNFPDNMKDASNWWRVALTWQLAFQKYYECLCNVHFGMRFHLREVLTEQLTLVNPDFYGGGWLQNAMYILCKAPFPPMLDRGKGFFTWSRCEINAL